MHLRKDEAIKICRLLVDIYLFVKPAGAPVRLLNKPNKNGMSATDRADRGRRSRLRRPINHTTSGRTCAQMDKQYRTAEPYWIARQQGLEYFLLRLLRNLNCHSLYSAVQGPLMNRDSTGFSNCHGG